MKIKILTMNLKKRGITVGDLLIIFIIILTTTTIAKSFNKDKKTAFYECNKEKASYVQTLFLKD